jgi:hypothetical protein
VSVINWTDTVTPLNAANMNQLEQVVRKGAANGYASLDGSGKVPLAQTPLSPVTNGQWLKGVGGVAVWADVAPAVHLIGTHAARPAANSLPAGTLYFSSDAFGTWRTDGANWTLIAQAAPLITFSSFAGAPWNTPYLGMRVLVQLFEGTNWEFQYNAYSTVGSKWEFVGGADYLNYTSGSISNGATVNSWINLVSSASTFSRSGEYVCYGSCLIQTGASAVTLQAAFALNGSIVGGSLTGQLTQNAGAWAGGLVLPPQKITINAGQNLTMMGMANQINCYFSQIGFTVRPVRIT